jgi:hypothetical protein
VVVTGWRQLSATVLEPLPLLATSILLGAATYAVVLWLTAQPLVRQAWQLFASIRQEGRALDSGAPQASDADAPNHARMPARLSPRQLR